MVRVTKVELNRTIVDIMKKGNLDQLTTKKIRILCEQKYNVDLSSRKQEIDNIVMSFINKHCNDKKSNADEDSESSSDESDSSEQQNSDYDSCSKSSSCSESECSYSSDGESKTKKLVAASSAQKSKVSTKPASVPAKKIAVKKPKKTINSQDIKSAAGASVEKKKESPAKRSANELDDAAYARQLQAEEWNFRQRTVKKLFRNVPQKKNDNEKSKKKKASPFMKKCLLSPALAEVLGTNEMSRPDVVQKMWAVVKERNLFDASNKQFAICDEQLFKIFGKKRIRVIGMMKYLKNHIKDVH